MKWITLFPVALSVQAVVSQGGTTTGGSGPYLANYTTDSTLTGHTIYAPEQTPDGVKLPVVVWGNGGCGANGLAFLAFLTEIASHGVFVISSGAPGGSGQTTAQVMKDSIDWVSENAGKGKYANVDASRIAAAGQSCGGLEAYEMRDDARVSILGIFNSGQFTEDATKQVVTTITKPTFFFLGGESDIAYANGERDYKFLPESTPTWKGNLPVGHGGTYGDTNGGKFGVAAVNFFKWTLRGDTSASDYFTGDAAKADGWTVESRALDTLEVTPI